MTYTQRAALRQGFSLFEIIIAITIVAVMMAVVVPGIQQWRGRAKKRATESALRTIAMNIEQYKTDTGQYPNGLHDLLYKPNEDKVARRWEGPYLNKESDLEDGWKQEVVYEKTPGGEHPYELYSWGPNGEGSPEEEWINIWEIS